MLAAYVAPVKRMVGVTAPRTQHAAMLRASYACVGAHEQLHQNQICEAVDSELGADCISNIETHWVTACNEAEAEAALTQNIDAALAQLRNDIQTWMNINRDDCETEAYADTLACFEAKTDDMCAQLPNCPGCQ
jgi:hypothetical protein